jgi:hypothetical protein
LNFKGGVIDEQFMYFLKTSISSVCNGSTAYCKFKPATVKITKYSMKFPTSELIVVMQVLNIPQNVGPNENYNIMYLCSLSLSYR